MATTAAIAIATPPTALSPPCRARRFDDAVPASEGFASTTMCYLPRAAPDSTFAAGCDVDDSDAVPTPLLKRGAPPGSGGLPCLQMLPPAFENGQGADPCDSSIESLPDASTMEEGGGAGGFLPGLPSGASIMAMMPGGADGIDEDDDSNDGPAAIEPFPQFEIDAGSAPASLCTTPTAAADATAAGTPDASGRSMMGVSSSAMAMSASVLAAGLVPVLDDGSLLLGPYRDANDAALCADRGVGAYLCVARECELPAHAAASGAPTLHLPLVDGPSEQLATHVPRACAWIDAQAAAGRRVVVFCRAGKSRSVSIAVAYVMHRTGMSGRAALAHVKAVHPRADPNLSFVHQIRAM